MSLIWPNGPGDGLRPQLFFTNPVGIVTRALLSAGHRAVGLCNVAIGFERDFASLLGVSPDRVSLGHVGLNHLTWERSVSVEGVDVLPELLDKHADEIAPYTGMTADFIRHLGMVPSYYLRYYYAHDAVVESLRGATTRTSTRMRNSHSTPPSAAGGTGCTTRCSRIRWWARRTRRSA